MKLLLKNIFFYLSIILAFTKVGCVLKDGDSVKGKCVFITDYSAVYNFHGLTADKDSVR